MPNGARFEAFWGQNGRKGRRFPLFFAKKVPMGAHSQVGKFFRSLGDAMRIMLYTMNGQKFSQKPDSFFTKIQIRLVFLGRARFPRFRQNHLFARGGVDS